MVQYVLLLPIQFNDGTPLPEEAFRDTYRELIAEFGGLTVEAQGIIGFRDYQGGICEEPLQRLIILDREDSPRTEFWRRYREVLSVRFRQVEILVTAEQIAPAG